MNEKIASCWWWNWYIRVIKNKSKKSGYNPYLFQKGEDILKFVEKERVDLAIIDLMLPDIDGLEILKK